MNLFRITTLTLSILANVAYGGLSLKTTLSAGYYRDIDQLSHTPATLGLEMDYIHDSGVEIFSEFSIDNHFVQDEWGAYPYQFYLSVPFGQTSEDRPNHQSRIQIGRQVLNEGFIMELHDGAYLPVYIGRSFKALLYGGLIRVPEEIGDAPEDLDNGHLYGGSAMLRLLSTDLKVGGYIRENEDQKIASAYATLFKEWNWSWLPSVLLKGEISDEEETDLKEANQYLAEFQFVPADDLVLNFGYSKRNPTRLANTSKNRIYRLFSISPTTSAQFAAVWSWSDRLSFHGQVEESQYTSSATDEIAHIGELGTAVNFFNARLSASATSVVSYGGKSYGLDLKYDQVISTDSSAILSGNVSYFEKMNGKTGYAYFGSAGYEYRMRSHWVALASVNIERNYNFEFDARAMIYVSHYYL